MYEITQSTGNEINRLHELATKSATEAIEYAKQAGDLLLQVKRQLPYGQLGTWIAQNLSVSVRQAQRYMAAAQGKSIPVGELADEYSNEPGLTDVITPELVESIINGVYVPSWRPEPGHWYLVAEKNGAYWVVPDLQNINRFHVSRLYSKGTKNGNVFFDGTRWAESADLVEIRLKDFGLAEPSQAAWKVFKKEGLSEPFGAPENHGKIRVVSKDGRVRWLPDAP